MFNKTDKKIRQNRLWATTALTSMALATSANFAIAAEWQVQRSVTLQEILTDNAGLNDEDESDLATQVRGEADARQVKDIRFAASCGFGGIPYGRPGRSCVSLIFSNEV